MSTTLLRVLGLLTIVCRMSAQHDTLFIDELGVKMPKSAASFYRVFKDTGHPPIEVNDYSLDHKLLVIGHFTNRQANIKEGHFVYFNREGLKIKEEHYKKGLPDGEWLSYYSNNEQIQMKQIFQAPERAYYQLEYDSLSHKLLKEGGMDENKKKHGLWKELHYYSDSIKVLNNYFHGVKVGEQLEYYRNGQIKRREAFEAFELIKADMFDEKGKKIKYFPAFEYPKPSENIPTYLRLRVKCFEKLFAAQNIDLRIHVYADGSLGKIEVLNVEEDDCKMKIIESLHHMRKWKPAKKENIAIDFLLERTLRFHTAKEF